VFGLFVMFLLDRLVLSRLGTRVMQVHGIGTKTHELDRLEINGEGEFSDLARKINRMLDTLEKTRQKVQGSEARFRELTELLPLIILRWTQSGILPT
jgi:methyl-accepting chemotaxis protein